MHLVKPVELHALMPVIELAHASDERRGEIRDAAVK